MIIRRAELKDMDRVLELLSQVLEIHAKLRPDIFNSGTTKYSKEQFQEMVNDDNNPIYVAVDDHDLLGYMFCEIINPKFSSTMKPNKTFYIDDLCVDEKYRQKKIGQALFDFAKKEAERLNCYEVALYLWEGNDPAKKFYEKMGMKVKALTMEYIVK